MNDGLMEVAALLLTCILITWLFATESNFYGAALFAGLAVLTGLQLVSLLLARRRNRSGA